MGKNFHPDFKPELTPKEMLQMGVFGGKYMTDCQKEFPADWFENAKLCSKFHDPNLNYFKVNASQPLWYWQKKGWIHPDDPRGWFQWYCRYFMGRRHEDDQRQIKRWKMMKRHLVQIKKNVLLEILLVEENSAKLCFIGPMTAEKSSQNKPPSLEGGFSKLGFFKKSHYYWPQLFKHSALAS